jgi:hypothetical protein
VIAEVGREGNLLRRVGCGGKSGVREREGWNGG